MNLPAKLKVGFVFALAMAVLVASCNLDLERNSPEAALKKLKKEIKKNLNLVHEKDEQQKTLLHHAAINDEPENARILISAGSEINARDQFNYTPLHFAAFHGSERVAELLIRAGADVNAKNHRGTTPLHWAAMNGHERLVMLLISNGAEMDVKAGDEKTPAQLAVDKGFFQIAEMLHPLHLAVKVGDLERVKSIVAGHPEKVNARDEFGKTPLHVAYKNDREPIIQFLLNSGAKEFEKDKYGNIPAYYSEARRKQRIAANYLSAAAVDKIDFLCYEKLRKFNHIKIALVAGGKIVFAKTYGRGKIGEVYNWESVSKPVTAMIIMQLFSQGKIRNLDDPIWLYSRRYADCMPLYYAGAPLTIKHLLTHKSGLPREASDIWRESKLNLAFRPGENDRFSTAGYVILGHIIEDVTGKSFQSALKEYITIPVGAYSLAASKSFTASGNCIRSNIMDMARFSIGVMNHTYVSESLLYTRIVQHYSGLYGFGWTCSELNSEDVTVFHSGARAVNQAFLKIKPKRKLSVSILAGTRFEKSFELNEFSDELLGILER